MSNNNAERLAVIRAHLIASGEINNEHNTIAWLLSRVEVLEGQLATAQAELEQQRYYGEQLQMSIESCSGNHDDALGLDGGGSE